MGALASSDKSHNTPASNSHQTVYCMKSFLAPNTEALSAELHVHVWGRTDRIIVWVTLTFLQAAPCPRVQCCHLLTGTNCVKLWPHTWSVHTNAQLSKVNPKQPHLLFVFDHPPMVSYSSYWVVYLFEILERETKVCFPQHKHTPTQKNTFT